MITNQLNAKPVAEVTSAPDESAVNPDPVNYVEVIETVISSLALEQSAMVRHTAEGYLWKFTYGSVEVFVQLTGLTDEDTLTVWSPLMAMPADNNAALMRKLLEMNWTETAEARFGIFNDQIVALACRTLTELEPGEIARAIAIVAFVADANDNSLRAEFGNA